MEIRVLGNRVLVERLKTTDITAGGLYIPETAKEKANVALVIAVGDGRRSSESISVCEKDDQGRHLHGQMFPRLKVAVEPGQRVLFGKYSGVDFEHEGKTLLFLREDEIFAILLDNVSVVK